MILNEKEKGIIDVFYASILKYQNEIFEFIYDDKKIICTFDTAYESDNCLDEDDPNYEEYFALIFRNVKNNLFEICYKNVPNYVKVNNKIIYKK